MCIKRKSRWKLFLLMSRMQVLLLTICTSLTLLVVQFLVLRSFVIFENQTISVEDDGVWKSVHLVTDEAESHGIHLFITDRQILGALRSNYLKKDDSCAALCQHQKVTNLGSLGLLSTRSQKEKFFNSLLSKGFPVFVASGYDPNLRRHGLQVQIPYSIFISAYGNIISINFLYDRPGKYWWQGRINETILNNPNFRRVVGNNSGLAISTFENAYDMFEIYPATVDGIKIHLPLSLHNAIQPKQSTRFTECNHTQAKMFYEKHKHDDSPEATEFRKKAWRLLAKAKNLLDELKIPFWLSSGTCLGYYRQCDFITYSKDVDIGIWIRDYNPKIVHKFSTNGLPLTHWFGKIQDSLELSFRDGDIKLDVFFFYEEPGYIWNGGTQARTGRKFKYFFPRFHLCWTEFLELKVQVPCQTLEYIRANYGKNWMEPTQVWDWKKSPSNVKENGQWPVEEWPEVIRLMSLPEQR